MYKYFIRTLILPILLFMSLASAQIPLVTVKAKKLKPYKGKDPVANIKVDGSKSKKSVLSPRYSIVQVGEVVGECELFNHGEINLKNNKSSKDIKIQANKTYYIKFHRSFDEIVLKTKTSNLIPPTPYVITAKEGYQYVFELDDSEHSLKNKDKYTLKATAIDASGKSSTIKSSEGTLKNCKKIKRNDKNQVGIFH